MKCVTQPLLQTSTNKPVYTFSSNTMKYATRRVMISRFQTDSFILILINIFEEYIDFNIIGDQNTTYFLQM